MTAFDNNKTIRFESGWMLTENGLFVPANLIDRPGLPAADWLQEVRAHLIQNKDRLAISTVKMLPGEINQEPRVTVEIAFDTGRTERKDSYGLLMETMAALKEQSGYGYYDYGQAFQIIENAVSIAKG